MDTGYSKLYFVSLWCFPLFSLCFFVGSAVALQAETKVVSLMTNLFVLCIDFKLFGLYSKTILRQEIYNVFVLFCFFTFCIPPGSSNSLSILFYFLMRATLDWTIRRTAETKWGLWRTLTHCEVCIPSYWSCCISYCDDNCVFQNKPLSGAFLWNRLVFWRKWSSYLSLVMYYSCTFLKVFHTCCSLCLLQTAYSLERSLLD